ncbi:sensor histidine kinase [Sphaerochaeta sp. PS]|uniref:cache domain-containing sensor histidine kinase n=1 Tax=Sphaerochaeta sp. PS TaxID=3076336 RepID=UPI0028A51633|nr:histidine kinase [Sphaerochaeta sp. PS]MDT4762792.1 histidine kinase [Sphaerochaeta sp. PS]
MRNTSNRNLRLFIRHSLPLVFVAILLGSAATIITRNFLMQNSIREANQTLEQASAYYDVILDEMDSLSLMFSTNPEMMVRLQNIFRQGTLDLDSYRESKLIRSFLSAPANARPYIDSIYVYLENDEGKVLSSNLGFTEIFRVKASSWFSSYGEKLENGNSYSEQLVVNRGTPTEQGIIRISRPITNPTGNFLGVIVLDLKESALAQSFGQFTAKEGKYLTVKNKQGSLLFSNPSEPCPYPVKKMQYFQTVSTKYGWEYTLGIYQPKLYELSTTLARSTIGLSLLALLLGLFLTHSTNRQERRFLSNVMVQLNQVGSSDLSEGSPSHYKNIFDYMNYHVIRTFLEQDYLRWQKEAMEYRALQMQINPHFLFNTLDTINWMAVKQAKGTNEVSQMIQLLSKLLKYSLQVEDSVGVPLAKELEQTNNYIEIQKIRFKDSLTFTQEIDPDLLDVQVPCMLLQPILENCLIHGFKGTTDLHITLTVRKDGEKVRIEIFNTGLALNEQELAYLNREDFDALKLDKSLGLMNIKKRLMLFAKGASPLTISSDGIQGVCVTILLPNRKG